MYNMTIRKWIQELEMALETLKNDYETFEEVETEESRHEVIRDIRDIRANLNVVSTKVKDLRCF